MAFRDWQDTEAADPLELPIRGKTYRIPALGHLDEIRMREEFARMQAGEAPSMSNEEFLQATLGDQLAAMRADNVPPKAIIHAAVVAHTDAQQGRKAAEEMWEHGPDPEALAAAIKAAANAGSTTSPNTDADGSSTKPPASTSGTRSRKTKAAQSRGTRSSTSPDS